MSNHSPFWKINVESRLVGIRNALSILDAIRDTRKLEKYSHEALTVPNRGYGRLVPALKRLHGIVHCVERAEFVTRAL